LTHTYKTVFLIRISFFSINVKETNAFKIICKYEMNELFFFLSNQLSVILEPKDFYFLLVDDHDNSVNQTVFEFSSDHVEHVLTNAVIARKVK
jgi:hypothetical protein